MSWGINGSNLPVHTRTGRLLQAWPGDEARSNTCYIIWGMSPREDLFQYALYSVVGNHLLLESVGACFGRLHHFDNLGVGTAFAFLQRRDGFLCHIW